MRVEAQAWEHDHKVCPGLLKMSHGNHDDPFGPRKT
jgi:hypothetical protein